MTENGTTNVLTFDSFLDFLMIVFVFFNVIFDKKELIFDLRSLKSVYMML